MAVVQFMHLLGQVGDKVLNAIGEGLIDFPQTSVAI
jgi:hypothetical protein